MKLISTITSLIGGKSLEFGMFKDISGQFRAGKLSSDSYFSQCRELVVSHKFNKFFPELLVLLPDIKKQQVRIPRYVHMDSIDNCQHFRSFLFSTEQRTSPMLRTSLCAQPAHR